MQRGEGVLMRGGAQRAVVSGQAIWSNGLIRGADGHWRLPPVAQGHTVLLPGGLGHGVSRPLSTG